MLGQQGLGLPNLAALSAGNAAASSIQPTLFGTQNAFGNHVVTALVPGEIRPVLVPSTTTVFFPAVTVISTGAIHPIRVDNQSRFFGHLFTWDQTVALQRFNNQNRFFNHTVEVGQHIPIYDFPIGHDLDSDYGMRKALTFYKRTLVIGRH